MIDNPAPQPENPPTSTPDIPPPAPAPGPETPTPPTLPTTAPPPLPNPRIKDAKPYNWPVIILSLLLLVAIGFAATFGYLYYQTSEVPPTVTQPNLTPTPDPTANWETYTNTEYNYSLKFPPTWRTQQVAAEAGDIEATSSARLVDIFDPEIKTYNPSTGGNHGFITVQYFDLLPEQFSNITPNTQIGNTKAIKVDNTYYVTLENGILEILVSLPTDTTKQSLFNQILSTFQFTDNLISTSNICKTNLTSQEFSINLPLELNASQDEVREEYYSQYTYSGSIGSLTISCGDTGGGCNDWQTIDIGNKESQACIAENAEKQTTTLGAAIKSPSGNTFSFSSEISNEPGNLDLLKQTLKTFQFSN